MPIDFKSCREEIAGALQEFCNRWCKQEHVESNALNSWKLNIFKIMKLQEPYKNFAIAGVNESMLNLMP